MISEIETTTDPVLSREDAIAILNTPDEELDQLIAQAEKLRRKYKGNHVSIHILTNARSGNCSQDCAYCAQSCRSKADIDKYKWVADEKLYKDNDFVNEHHLSRHCIGLSGMKFTDEEIEELASKIRKMKEDGTHLCCSIGFLTEKQALMLKEAGLSSAFRILKCFRDLDLKSAVAESLEWAKAKRMLLICFWSFVRSGRKLYRSTSCCQFRELRSVMPIFPNSQLSIA